MQTRKQSFTESILNVTSGMVIAFTISQIAVHLSPYIPGFHYEMDVASNVVMTVVLTIVSVLRGYCWRRYFSSHVQLNPEVIKEFNKRVREHKKALKELEQSLDSGEKLRHG